MEKSKEINKNTEQKIIEVATELFAEKGYDGASTREICNKANVNISLISYYFGGKEGLYKKVVDDIVGHIIEHAMTQMKIHGFPISFDSLGKDKKLNCC